MTTSYYFFISKKGEKNMSFAEIISAIDDFVWGPVMLILLVGTGVFPVSYTHLDVYKRQD